MRTHMPSVIPPRFSAPCGKRSLNKSGMTKRSVGGPYRDHDPSADHNRPTATSCMMRPGMKVKPPAITSAPMNNPIMIPA